MPEDDPMIKAPKHYLTPYGWQPIDKVRHLTFNLSSAVKYCLRAGVKDPKTLIQDLKKAQYQLKKELEFYADGEHFEDPVWDCHQAGVQALASMNSVMPDKDRVALEFMRDQVELDVSHIQRFYDDLSKVIVEEEAKAFVPVKTAGYTEQLTKLVETTDPREWAKFVAGLHEDKLSEVLSQFKELCRVEGVRDGYSQCQEDFRRSQ